MKEKKQIYNWMDFEVGLNGDDKKKITEMLKEIQNILNNYPSSKDPNENPNTSMAKLKDIIDLAIESVEYVPKDTVLKSIVDTREKINAMPGSIGEL